MSAITLERQSKHYIQREDEECNSSDVHFDARPLVARARNGTEEQTIARAPLPDKDSQEHRKNSDNGACFDLPANKQKAHGILEPITSCKIDNFRQQLDLSLVNAVALALLHACDRTWAQWACWPTGPRPDAQGHIPHHSRRTDRGCMRQMCLLAIPDTSGLALLSRMSASRSLALVLNTCGILHISTPGGCSFLGSSSTAAVRQQTATG
jgi:hypothetical protein